MTFATLVASFVWAILAIILILVPCNPTQYYTHPETCTNRVSPPDQVYWYVLIALVVEMASNKLTRYHHGSLHLWHCVSDGLVIADEAEVQNLRGLRIFRSITCHSHRWYKAPLSPPSLPRQNRDIRVLGSDAMANGLCDNVLNNHGHGSVHTAIQ